LIAACMGDGGIDMEISHRLRFKLGKVDGEKVMGVSLSEWTDDPNGWWMPAPAKVLEWIEFLKLDDTFDSNHRTWFYVLYSPNTNVMYGAVHTFATKWGAVSCYTECGVVEVVSDNERQTERCHAAMR
jgi:hypothetical protein